ncbi:GlcG/HbpS family heme-binding protein [Pseudoxanthomonas composti]|uniref:Heme-binding protein n=1 Tax=Pseudoxanthomonas composti TaxID=2137479 RepID=A0A4Q1K025_9GAMM|nr:heme-binding protein [Pseudoxanthomonas composti]RXR08777.1 heme-binding protein [Pseudoxanthomonas composti]
MPSSLSESTVQQIIERARTLASEQHFAINVAVVDEAGLLRGFLRQDDAVAGAIDVAIKKARTAALFRTDSLELGATAHPGGAIYTLEATNGGLISFGGGVVLRDARAQAIGAVGVAGATVEADQAIALRAAGRA